MQSAKSLGGRSKPSIRRAFLLAFLLGACAAHTPIAYTKSSPGKPGLPPPPIAVVTPADIYGDAKTREVEAQLLTLLKRTPRPDAGTASATKIDPYLVQTAKLLAPIKDAEQLERLAYWCHSTAGLNSPPQKSPYFQNNDLSILDSAFCSALAKLKKNFGSAGRDRIFEVASLVKADGHAMAEINTCLTNLVVKGQPFDVPSCYVIATPDPPPQPEDTSFGKTIEFNLTRTLRKMWHPHWNGDSRYLLTCKFVLSPDGKAKDIQTSQTSFRPGTKIEMRKAAERSVRDFLLSAEQLTPNYLKKPVHVDVQFFD